MTDIDNQADIYDETEDEILSRLDSIWLGLAIGIVAPVLSFLIFYTTNFTKVSFDYFIHYSIRVGALINILTVCLVPNFLVFALFIWRSHYKSAKGMVIASASLTALIILAKIAITLYLKR